MCGRFTMTASREALTELFPLFDLPAEVAPRYNVAPSQGVLAARVAPGTDKSEIVTLKWGLVPFWADGPAIGNRMINARAETAPDKPAFRAAFRQRHCLILADGFYEWRPAGKHKQPYLFRLRDGRAFAFAGLWERWARDDEVVESCTILTTAANDLVRPVHERMPVIVAPADCDAWLDPKSARGRELLRPYPAEAMTALPVGTRVNNPKFDDAGCVAALVV
jgi:putative SOS response-associated peptidase YedK